MHWTICTHTPWSRNLNSFILVSNDFPPARTFAMLELDRQCFTRKLCWTWDSLSLSQQRYLANLFNKWLATVFQQQQSPVKWLRLEWWQGLTRTGILWLTDLWKPFLSFRGHFSCGNSRISSNNKSYNLPFCEQLIALQMCINQNPASLTVLPDTSSTTWFKFSFISEYLVSCQIPPFRYDDTPPWWWWWWW